MGNAARPLKWEEVEAIKAVCLQSDKNEVTKYRDLLLVTLGCSTGFRWSEMSSLRWKDLIDKDHVVIPQPKQHLRKRKMALTEPVKAIIAQAYNAFVASIPPSKRSRTEEWYVFTSVFTRRHKDSAPLTRRGVKNILENLMNKASIDGAASSHSMRKAFAMRMFELLGGDEAALIETSYWIDHQDTATTRRYLGFTKQKHDQILSQLWD